MEGANVAECLRQLTWNPQVAGSSPALTTKLELFLGISCSNTLSFIFIYLRRGWCCNNEGVFLLLKVEVLTEEIAKPGVLAREVCHA